MRDQLHQQVPLEELVAVVRDDAFELAGLLENLEEQTTPLLWEELQAAHDDALVERAEVADLRHGDDGRGPLRRHAKHSRFAEHVARPEVADLLVVLLDLQATATDHVQTRGVLRALLDDHLAFDGQAILHVNGEKLQEGVTTARSREDLQPGERQGLRGRGHRLPSLQQCARRGLDRGRMVLQGLLEGGLVDHAHLAHRLRDDRGRPLLAVAEEAHLPEGDRRRRELPLRVRGIDGHGLAGTPDHAGRLAAASHPAGPGHVDGDLPHGLACN
mmetsp:Transcript_31318/g.91329  ORF Transcript_31318/g.91329 Transcript_31318/m.91329 type:complete len:273 (+) Transcript_31318:1219-2037(+)